MDDLDFFKPNQRLSNGRFAIGNTIGTNIDVPNIGCPPKWETPAEMYKSFLDYINYCIDVPMVSVEYYGKDATRCEVPKMKATTIMGFCRFCNSVPNTFYIYSKKSGFEDVSAYIANSMSSNNIEGAAAGLLNHSIISRLEGLVDKKQVDSNVTQRVVFYQPQIPPPSASRFEPGDEDLIEFEEVS